MGAILIRNAYASCTTCFPGEIGKYISMPEFCINELFIFIFVYKTSEIIYGTVLLIKLFFGKGHSLTLHRQIRKFPKLKAL